jgi:hypothetical protein
MLSQWTRVRLRLSPFLNDQLLQQMSLSSCRFSRRLHYWAEPVPPLAAEDAAWADALLKAKGLR